MRGVTRGNGEAKRVRGEQASQGQGWGEQRDSWRGRRVTSGKGVARQGLGRGRRASLGGRAQQRQRPPSHLWQCAVGSTVLRLLAE